MCFEKFYTMGMCSKGMRLKTNAYYEQINKFPSYLKKTGVYECFRFFDDVEDFN